MVAPVVLAVSETVAPDADAVTEAPESALMLDASADEIEDVVVPDPLQLVPSACPFTVMMLVPES